MRKRKIDRSREGEREKEIDREIEREREGERVCVSAVAVRPCPSFDKRRLRVYVTSAH